MTTTPVWTVTDTRRARLLAVLGALLALVAGLLMPTPGAEARSVVPAHGSYHGVDHAGRPVSFTFSGNQMTHFTVGHRTIGGAHVSSGAWHETCHDGWCSHGRWTTDTHVSGYWSTGGGHQVPFTATRTQPVPYVGTYLGRDTQGTSLRFSYRNGYLRSVVVNGRTYADVPVNNGRFEACQPGLCLWGHWQDSYEVVGHWSTHHGGPTITWTAFAYAS